MSTDFVIGHCSTINPYTVAIDPQEILKHIEPPKKVKVATGCPLCDKIWSSKETYEYSTDWPDKIAIVMEDEKPWLYIPCEDSYYSDTKLQINWCPKCGRELLKNE